MTEIQLIEEMLRETTEIVQEKYIVRASVEVTTKSDPNDLLTEADLAVQDVICERIAQIFPNDAIAAEERNLDHQPADPNTRCWVIDPIDGTQNFVRGIYPTFGISIAFAVGGRPVAGGIMFPIDNDLFLAEQGAGTHRNGKPQHVSPIADTATARIEIDFADPRDRKETLTRAAMGPCFHSGFMTSHSNSDSRGGSTAGFLGAISYTPHRSTTWINYRLHL